ncbi:MAG: prenyltransferase/squalene oxidase repeat-containing protein, partial [Methanomassiliicoccales archaeon]
MRNRAILTVLMLQIILASIAFAQTTQVTNGLNYLASTQSADGSWRSGEEQTIATAETLETLKLFNQSSTANYANALSWLQSQSLESTNHLAERIYILSAGGTDSTTLISYLNTLKKAWGGNGEYSVNNLDTALALQALRTINCSDQTTIKSAISYLLANQNTDGGWGFDNGDESNLYMTAIVSRI